MKVIVIGIVAAMCLSTIELEARCCSSSSERSSRQTSIKRDDRCCGTRDQGSSCQSAASRAMRLSQKPTDMRDKSEQVNEKIATLEAKIEELQQQLAACYVAMKS